MHYLGKTPWDQLVRVDPPLLRSHLQVLSSYCFPCSYNKERTTGTESRCRDQSVDQKLKLWKEEMFVGTERGLNCCLRGKLGLQNVDGSLRDPVYYRCSEPFVRMVPRHKKHESAGLKETTFAKRIWIEQADAMVMMVDEEVSLMDWGNAIVKEIIKDQNGYVIAITGILHLEGSVKTTKLKLTWLPCSSELVSLTIIEFPENMFGSVKEVLAFGDSDMKHLKCGDVVRLERKGYFRCDDTEANSLVLFAIPDGKTPFSFC